MTAMLERKCKNCKFTSKTWSLTVKESLRKVLNKYVDKYSTNTSDNKINKYATKS